MAVLKGDIQEEQARILTHEHATSSFRDNAKAVAGKSIYKGQAHYVHVLDTICYHKVPGIVFAVNDDFSLKSRGICSKSDSCRNCDIATLVDSWQKMDRRAGS